MDISGRDKFSFQIIYLLVRLKVEKLWAVVLPCAYFCFFVDWRVYRFWSSRLDLIRFISAAIIISQPMPWTGSTQLSQMATVFLSVALSGQN